MKIVNKLLIVLVVIGVTLVVVGFSLGGAQQITTMHKNRHLSFTWGGMGYHDVNADFTGIENLDIDVSASKVVIKEYAGTSIKVEGENIRESIKIEKQGNTLVIKEGGFWSFGFNIWEDSKCTVYIPTGQQFNRTKFEVDAGSIVVEGKLQADQVEVNVDAGSFIAETIICNSAEVDVSAGSTNVQLLDSQRSEFDVDAGSIYAGVVGEDVDYSYNAKCDVGKIKIGQYRASGISSNDSGGSGVRKINADCSAGDIEIQMRGV